MEPRQTSPARLSSTDIEVHGSYVRQLALALVRGRDPDRAEDLSQDVWTVWASRAPASLKNPRGWLAGVARRLSFRHDRDERHRRDREVATASMRRQATAPEDEESERWLQLGDRLQSALSSLEVHQRTALTLRYYGGLSPTEIALRQGVSLGTVKSRLKRGLAELRRRMEGDHPGWLASLAPLLLPSAEVPLPPPLGAASKPLASIPWTRALRLVSAALVPVTLMKLKVAASTLLVAALSAFLWIERGQTEEPVVPVDPARSGAPYEESQLAGLPAAQDRMQSAPATAPSIAKPVEQPAAEAKLYCLNVTATNQHGSPLIGAKVWVAPTDGMLNLVGRTNSVGELQAQWEGNESVLEVDVIVDGVGRDSGVQRVLMRAERPFQLRASIGRPFVSIEEIHDSLASLEGRLSGLQSGELNVEAPVELQTRWQPPLRYFLPAVQQQDFKISFAGAASLRLRRSSQTAEAYHTSHQKDKSLDFDAMLAASKRHKDGVPSVGTISVVALDHMGLSAAGLQLLIDRPSWDPALGRQARGFGLDVEGKFNARVPPGETVLSLGHGETRQEKSFQVAAGETIHWPVGVDRSGELLLRLEGAGARDLGEHSVLVRHQGPDSLWIARAFPNSSGAIMITGSPVASLNVHVLGAGEVAPLPTATFPGVPLGELTTLNVEANAVPTARLRLAPLEVDPEVQRVRHVFAFGEGQDFGALLDLKLTSDSVYELVVPASMLRVEVAADRAARTVIAAVDPAPGARNNLGAISLTELGTLVVGPLDAGAAGECQRVRLYRVGDALDVLMADRELDPSVDVEERLPEGNYRVEWWSPSEPLGKSDVLIRGGEQALARD